MCTVATKLPKGGKDVPPEALEGLQQKEPFREFAPFWLGRQARRMGCSRMGRGVVEHATLRHGCRWVGLCVRPCLLEVQTRKIFAHGRCCHHWNSSKLQASKPVPKFERGWATASSAPRPWQAHSDRVLIFSRRTPPHEDFSGRGSSPHVSPGCLPIGLSYGRPRLSMAVPAPP